MKQQPDKLFHDKLASYSRPTPTRAWDAIEAELDKKRRKGILWFRVAAAILLLGSASYVLWYIYGPVRDTQGQLAGTGEGTVDSVEAPLIAEASANTTSTMPTEGATMPASAGTHTTTEANTGRTEVSAGMHATTAANAGRTEASAGTHSTRSAGAGMDATTPSNGMKKQEPSAVPTQPYTTETTVAIAETKKPNASSVPTVETPVYTNATEGNTYASALAEAKPATHERITLVYSAREADEYLDKKGLAEATSDEEKPSTLKKLLKKAADLKSNQDPLGELRQRKNEILALSFKSDKQRGQNK